MANSGRSINASEIHVIYVDIRHCQFSSPEGLLSEDEIERARKYRLEADSSRYVTARHMLRSVLSAYLGCKPGNISFEYGTSGKPALRGEPAEGLHFNLAHSGDLVVVAVSRGHRVGVDIERMGETFPADVCGRFFSANEAAALEQCLGEAKVEMFYRLWTRKEALLKATGLGLSGLPECPDMRVVEDVTMQGVRWDVRDLYVAEGYKAALAVEGSAGEVETLRWNNG